MANTYAIADLHGRFDLLEMAITAIEADAPDGGRVVFLGDYVDRGPQSAQIIERLMAGPADPSKWAWVCLQGNHEAMMLTCLNKRGLMHWWLGNGGGATLISYGAKNGDLVTEAADRVSAQHIAWLEDLHLFEVDDHRVYVHAGVDPAVSLAMQDAQVLQWKLYDEGDQRGHSGRHVVHGHHQFADGPILLEGRTDLDTFAWWTGRLVIGVFDDDTSGGPARTIEVIGAPFTPSA
jgi:serine/threonine protein phosphatase 1